MPQTHVVHFACSLCVDGQIGSKQNLDCFLFCSNLSQEKEEMLIVHVRKFSRGKKKQERLKLFTKQMYLVEKHVR